MSRFIKILLSLLVTFQFPHQTRAGMALTEKEQWQHSAIVLPQIKTIDQVMFMMALGGASVESLKSIRTDLEKRNSKSNQFPKLQLRDQKLILNGIESGVKIVSLNPFNITYKGKTWAFKREALPEVNYLSLLKFLGDEKNHVSRFDLLFEKAFADEIPNSNQVAGAITGGALGFGLGVTASAILIMALMGTGPGGWVLAGIVLGSTALLGYYGSKAGARSDLERSKFTTDLVNACPKVTCNREKVELISVEKKEMKIVIKKDLSSDPIELYDHTGRGFSPEYVTKDQKKILTQLRKCESQADAQMIQNTCLQAAKAAQDSETKKNPSGKSNSQGVQTSGSAK